MLTMSKKVFIIAIWGIFCCAAVFAEPIVFQINIEGNDIVSSEKVISAIKIRSGQPYNENIINKDIKNLIATGFFETVDVQKQDVPQGIILIFRVKEKSILKELTIEGARFIRRKKIEEAAGLTEGSFVDEFKLKEVTGKIKDLYTAKGFSNTTVSYAIKQLEKPNEVQVTITINEKRKVKVRRVVITGNEAFSSRRLIKVMKLRKAWIFNPGTYREDVLDDDIKRLSDFYRLEGFSDVNVEAKVDFQRKGAVVNIAVIEGRRYYIGKIKISGHDVLSYEEIKAVIKLKEGDLFNDQGVYEDSSKIREAYVDRGYIFSRVTPQSHFNMETEKVDIVYEIVENRLGYVDKIHIRGNDKTKDKVIRRELRVYPGDIFDGKKVRKSKNRLDDLEFFEEVRLGTERGSADDRVNLIVDVKEAKTGYLTFGGGYSTIDKASGFIEIRQKNFDYKNFPNFTGAGQDLSLAVNSGMLSERYQLSFTNPWIFDRPVSFGFDAYKNEHDRESDVGYAYDEDIRGGAIRLGKAFNDQWKGRVAFRFESVEIADVDDLASQELKDEVGKNDLIGAEVGLSFDTRNSVINPSTGILIYNSFFVSGGPFGGDKDFYKNTTGFNIYFPVFADSVLEFRAKAGLGEPFEDTQKIPIYRRFFAGGSASIRGYHERKIGPVDPATDGPIGGEALFAGSVEFTYPVADFIKLATFFDSGNVWAQKADFMSSGLFSSVGLGIRIKTPIGPVSLDYGWPLDLEPGEEKKSGRFHFNISRGF